ncbi:uncharacterized protein VDAG_01990 [Verticillium dahliae VdLs.17]|uniref:Zn(2)-C6 fungal-type domain-containing protein n=1 Tax=Verticillium dahliae (strain VdLs.17 / ATCC MYA-4575 / FGSC 10137) TaxID=498257 RepID=G2WWK4_VERDV|nr:uncharacterized protein VDAG_01990 [Verticillium dahliae VdLs.17]EGY19974.1 hypothetical protein VDAG_01990 [Verticillium dahliae VdLs.17]
MNSNQFWEANGQADANAQLTGLGLPAEWNTTPEGFNPNTYTPVGNMNPLSMNPHLNAAFASTPSQAYSSRPTMPQGSMAMSYNNVAPQGNMVLQDTTMSQGNMVPQGNMMIPQGNMAPQPSFLHVPAQGLSSPLGPTNYQAQDYSYQQRRAEYNAAVQTQRQEFQRANKTSRSRPNRRRLQARIENNRQSQSIPAGLPEGLIDSPVASAVVAGPVAAAGPVVETTGQDPGQDVDPVAGLESLFGEGEFGGLFGEGESGGLFGEGEFGGLFGEGDFENLFGDDELEAFFGESGGEPDTGTATAGAAVRAPSPRSLAFLSSLPSLPAMVSESVPERTPVATSPATLSESTSPGTEQPAKKRRTKIGSQSCEMCRKSRKACHRQENTYSCVRCHTAGMPCNKFDPNAAKPSDGRTNNTVQRNHQRIYDEGRSVIEKLWKTLAAIVPQSANEAPELVARRLALAQAIQARMPTNNVESWVPITDMEIEALGLAMYGINFRPDCFSIVGGSRSHVERPSRCEKLVEERKACHDLVDKVSRFVTALVDCIGYAADPSSIDWLPTHVANLLNIPSPTRNSKSRAITLSPLPFKKHLGNIANNAATA